MRLRSQRKLKPQSPLGVPQGRETPRSRRAVAHATNPRTSSSAQPQLFLDTSAPQYAIGGYYPLAMAGGDFNGDGSTDLVAIYSSMVSVLLGNGDGTFQPHVDYATGSFPHSVVVGDFNRDGHADIVTSSSSYMSVLLGNGNGTFQTHVDYAVCSGGDYLAVADFNGDGNLDLAFPNSCDNNSVTILLGKGDGTFQTPVNSPVGTNPGSIAVGDFNNDGRADLAVVVASTVSILLGNGDGTFQAPIGYSNVRDPLVVADVNGDGNVDLLAMSEAGTLVVLLGNGDGTFRDPVDTGTSVGNYVAVGDFDHDGNVDIAWPNNFFNSVSVWLGNGDGTFRNSGEYSTGAYPISVVVGDFNADGKADLTVLNSNNGSVSVLLGYGDGTFPNPPRYPTGAGPISMASGDFNGDGMTDLVTANFTDESVSVLLGNGDGTFHKHVDYATGSLPASVAVGDLNRDGHADVVTKSFSFLSVLLGNGNGTLQPHVDYPVGSGEGWDGIAVGDFNGDGIPDLAAANEYDNSVSILLGKGDGTFQAHVDYAVGAFPKSPAVGDFNGDGKADLAVANGIGSVSVLLGNGDGTFQAPADYPVGGSGDSPDAVATGDFDGDGKTDLAVAYQFGSSVSILLSNGDGSFKPPVDYATGDSYQYQNWVGVGDFNGDGKPDLAVVNSSDCSVSVLLGNGDGTFQAQTAHAIGQVFRTATIADFNGDGAPELGFVLRFVEDAAGVILQNVRGTGLQIQSSQSSVNFGVPVTLTATIRAGLSGVSLPSPTGTLKFMDGTNQLSTQTLSADGVVTFATSTLTSGTHNISAVYSGDANFNPHTVALVQVVNGPDFTINATPGSGTIKSGNSAVFSVAVSPMDGFKGSVSLTCSVSPTPALAPTCSLNPTSVTPTTTGSATSNLTVLTTGSTAALLPIRLKSDWRSFYALLLPVCGLALLGTGLGRSGSKRKKFTMAILVTTLLAMSLVSQVACGGSSSGTASSGTPSGQYTVTVNAVSGAVTHATKVTLSVQ